MQMEHIVEAIDRTNQLCPKFLFSPLEFSVCAFDTYFLVIRERTPLTGHLEKYYTINFVSNGYFYKNRDTTTTTPKGKANEKKQRKKKQNWWQPAPTKHRKKETKNDEIENVPIRERRARYN